MMAERFTARLARYQDLILVAIVTLAAWAMRMAFLSRAPLFVSKDSQSYFLPAWDLIHGGDFQLGLRRTPGYPLFLAAEQLLLGPDLQAIAFAQHLLGVLTAVMAYFLGAAAFGRAAGLVGGMLVALSAPMIVYEHYLLSEALFTAFLTGALLLLVTAVRQPTHRTAFLAGLGLGLAALVRPVAQVLAPWLMLGLAMARWGRWRDASVLVLLALVGLAAALLPWTLRNRLTQDLGGTTTFGRTLIARTAYHDRGFTFYEPGWGDEGDPLRVEARKIVQDGANRRQSDGTIAGRLRQELNLSAVQVNGLMREVALEAIARRPWYFIQGSASMAVRIFVGIEERVRNHAEEIKDVVWETRTSHLLQRATPAQSREQGEAQQVLNVYQPAHFSGLLALMFALGTVGALLRPEWRPALVLPLAVITHIGLSAALDGPQERYRYPMDPAISVVVGGGLLAVVEAVRSVICRLRALRGLLTRAQPRVAQ